MTDYQQFTTVPSKTATALGRAGGSSGLHLEQARREDLRLFQAAVRRSGSRGRDQPCATTPSIATPPRARTTVRWCISRPRPTRRRSIPSPSCSARSSAWRRSTRSRRQARRSRADLHADDRRGRVCHVGLRAHRRDPLGGVRRFRGRLAATRIDDAKPVLMVSSDAGMRNGKAVPYKHLVDEARARRSPPAKVLIVDRGLDKGFPRWKAVTSTTPSCRHAWTPRSRSWARVLRAELHPAHVRHHRQAQGRAARHRRLPPVAPPRR